MSFGKVNGIRELNHLPQEIWPGAKALDDAGNLFPSGTGTPEVIGDGRFARSLGIFDESNFGRRFWLVLWSGDGLPRTDVVRHEISPSTPSCEAKPEVQLSKMSE
jgi:hypothetical protein